ncbi:Glutamate [NMDA] receptor subunit 1 [Lamellibrachia satsuma]|nr:Glutamate [NMDA] receptor subunit 1 [Lamellibrachia satsuma]
MPLLIILTLVLGPVRATLPKEVTIGALLSSHENGAVFVEAVNQLNGYDNSAGLPSPVHFNATYTIMDANPLRAAKAVCDDVIPNQVYVVIAGSKSYNDLSSMAVSFTCGFYRIPTIGISVRDSVFSDKNLHMSFMRMVPPYKDQAKVWVELLKYFQFKKVVILGSSDQEGRAILGRFRNFAEDADIEIEKTIAYSSNNPDLWEHIDLSELRSRVILLYASMEDAEKIYAKASAMNLTEPGNVWIVTEQALNAPNIPEGVLGLRLLNGDNTVAHIEDSIHVIGSAFRALQKDMQNITEAPHSCTHESGWNSGLLLLDYLKAQKVLGKTGEIAFNEDGDSEKPVYEVVNTRLDSLKVIGHYGGRQGDRLSIHTSDIIWPGHMLVKPKGIKISTHLQVVTIESIPFIYTDPISDNDGSCAEVENRIPCVRPNSTGGQQKQYCCYGYVIDLLIKLSQKVNFTYDLHLVEDNNYGTFEIRNGSSKKTWNGMIGELLDNRADLILAPLTIDPERAKYVDFSKPFKYQGLTILVKKTMKDSSLASFLQPFQNTLWILVGLSVHVVALVLYLLDHFSPFGRFKLAKNNDTEEDALNLSSAMWFAWGVLLNSGIGEGTPRSFSARVLGMVWAGFAMIIVASYTANLAAFLVLDRREASVSGIDDARLRNPQQNFNYATVKNSAVLMYFKRQVELSTMYRTMLDKNYDTAEEAIRDVKEGRKLQAFIWDSSRLEYEAAKDCDLSTAGELFGRSGYGIGLEKDSPWTEEISLAILSFHESGFMEQLDGRWILVKDAKCPEKNTSPATLGLTNMAGVFMMVAGGIIAGVLLIFVEIAYKRHRGLKEKELELAKTAADRWRGNIEKRKVLRQSWQYLHHERLAYETAHLAANPATAAAVGAGEVDRWQH